MSLEKKVKKGDTLKCPDGHNVVIDSYNYVNDDISDKNGDTIPGRGFFCHVCEKLYTTRELYNTKQLS